MEFQLRPGCDRAHESADKRLRDDIGTGRKTETDIFELAEAAEPGIKIEKLRNRLQAATKMSLSVFQERRGIGWEVRTDPQNVKGQLYLAG